MNSPIPSWLEPVNLETWPTQIIESTILHYKLPLREGWAMTPEVYETLLEIEHTYHGLYRAEWLKVSFMSQADPAADMPTWVEAIMALTGFPVLLVDPGDDPLPSLLEWNYEGPNPTLAQRLAVDETHLYQGLARLPGSPPELARLYILMARRATLAWKISLSFLSACLPGLPEEMVISNDHVRAGATFGHLHLL